MRISYKKLWKLLIDRDMLKKDLAEKAGISNASIAKLGRNEIPPSDITCPKKLTSFNQNSQFDNLAYNFFFLK